jgi:HSP20 family molecular chaperone IbpA
MYRTDDELQELHQEAIKQLMSPAQDTGVSEYPLTNIGVDQENGNLLIEVSAPGFKKSNIDVEVVGCDIHISGTYESTPHSFEFYQTMISEKDFTRVIHLDDEYLDGEFTASMNDGIISVEITPAEVERFIVEVN